MVYNHEPTVTRDRSRLLSRAASSPHSSSPSSSREPAAALPIAESCSAGPDANLQGRERPPIEWLRIWPFLLMQACCLLVFVVGWSPIALIVCALLYAVRMFGITAFYHRYFSHRSFEAGRVVQFLGALLGASATQRGPLWWAAHHRRHHRHSDTDCDLHSPHAHGFLWSHIGWIAATRNVPTDMDQVRDLARFPELRWLDRFDLVVPLLLLGSLLALGGVLEATAPELGTSAVQMGVWGFCVSTTLLFHATASINSLCHVFGRKHWPTRDQSRNSLLLALVTFGEGWHNNHHWCPGAVRQGFRWWQIDLSWYGLWFLSQLGLVARLRPLPARARIPRRQA